MRKVGRFAAYAFAFFIFLVCYALAATVTHFVVLIVNSDSSGWVREYVLPYFIAAIAGAMGSALALSAVESLFSTLSLRIIVWAFVVLSGVVWIIEILGMMAGRTPSPATGQMAVQMVAALVAAFKLSASNRT